MVYLHNFYLNPMFDPSGPRPGADAHNCTVGYVSEYKPPSCVLSSWGLRFVQCFSAV